MIFLFLFYRNDDDDYGSKSYDDNSGMEPDGVIESNWNEIVDSFDDMNLKEELLRGIYAYGFEKPSAIQQRAILPCIKGHDVIAQAQSGTGKTATFSIAILQQIDTSVMECQVLVLFIFFMFALLLGHFINFFFMLFARRH